MRISSFFTYAFFSAFLAFWWIAAFKNPNANEPKVNLSVSANKSNDLPFEIQNLSLFPDRELLRKALLGDISLISKLIVEWDINADLLINEGYSNIKRLDRQMFLKGQRIVRLLESNEKEFEAKATLENSAPIIDDRGFPHDLSKLRQKFFPQTYMAASILLSLVEPQNISALPKGMKAQSHIYASDQLDAIQLEFDRFTSESLALNFPDLAFVSKQYSNPTCVDILSHLGIEIFYTPDILSFEDIKKAVQNIGNLVGKPLKAELLTIFIEAALQNCDNCLEIRKSLSPLEKTLVTNYYTHFSLPGKQSLTYSILSRLRLNNKLGEGHHPFFHRNGYTAPLSEEEIVFFNPDRLIILGDLNASLEACLLSKDSLRGVSAIQSKQVSFIPEDVQWTPSQFLVLAYYDLAKALCD